MSSMIPGGPLTMRSSAVVQHGAGGHGAGGRTTRAGTARAASGHRSGRRVGREGER
ncbi:hypothetical protein OHB01_11035 [Microbispora hainanensis]|uniref:hypothetical protein n=1 Tax=Microbispora hainanensis TaxID=568844 RepID=UPI002E28CCD3|nr:hypothetical protein [Microbispora hainanensis]